MWAYALQDDIPRQPSHDAGDRIRFGLHDMGALTNDHSEVKLVEPFKQVARMRSGDWQDNIKSLVVFYFLEKNWVRSIAMSEQRLRDLEKACSIVAEQARKYKPEPTRQAPVLVSLPLAPSSSNAVARNKRGGPIRLLAQNRLVKFGEGSSSQLARVNLDEDERAVVSGSKFKSYEDLSANLLTATRSFQESTRR